MSKNSDLFSEVGVLAGAMTATLLDALRRQQAEAPAASGQSSAVPEPEARPAAPEADTAARLAQIEARLEEHAAKLAQMPSTGEIVGAMEQLIAKIVNSLDDRFTSQARSIEALKGAAAQTDSLLERVLESLDALEPSGPLELAGDGLAERQTG